MRAGSELLVVVVCLGLAACSKADIVSVDAGTDAGGGETDAGGGETDAGVDAGPMLDAGGTDAGLMDAGPPDAGPDETGETPGEGELVISEIMVDSDAVTDDCGEWIELHNPSDTVTYDLRGCTLHDSSNVFSFTTSVPVPPGAFFSLSRFEPVYCRDALGIPDPGFDADASYTDVKFGNEGDSAWIACGGTTVDRVDFGTWTVRKGRSFNLDPDSLEAVANDDVANWCDGTAVYNMEGADVDRGTPGMPNTDC